MDCFYQVRPPEEGVGVPRALAWNLGSPVTPVWHLLSSARLDPGGRWDKEARRLCQGWEEGWAEISSIRKCGRDKRCVCAVFVGRSSNWGLAFHKQPLGKDLVNLLRRAQPRRLWRFAIGQVHRVCSWFRPEQHLSLPLPLAVSTLQASAPPNRRDTETTVITPELQFASREGAKG